MPEYTYRVIPFRAEVKGLGNPTEIASQLESAIRSGSSGGYELMQVATVTVEVAPGCLGSMMGQKTGAITYEQLVFRKLVG